jgi:hypothetical protein
VHSQFIKRSIGLHLIDLGTSPTDCQSCSTPSPSPLLRLSIGLVQFEETETAVEDVARAGEPSLRQNGAQYVQLCFAHGALQAQQACH